VWDRKAGERIIDSINRLEELSGVRELTMLLHG